MGKTKVCSKCGEIFPLTDEYFQPRTNGKDGFRNQCRKCRNMNWRPKQEQYEEGTKKCCNCGKILPLTKEYFEPKKICKDGFLNQCRECRNTVKQKRILKSKQIEYCGYVFTRDQRGYYLSAQPIYKGNRIPLHRYIWIKYNGDIPKGYVVHHIDENKENNDISNFKLMTNYKHSKMHGDEIARDNYDELMENLSTRFSEESKAKQKAWRESEEGKNFYIEQAKRIKDSGIYDRTESLICEYCGSEFKTTILNSETTKYCSGKCADKARKESGIDDIERECIVCGKKFIINKRKVRQTCSDECKYIIRGQSRSKNTPPNEIEKECVICGNKFITHRHRPRKTCCNKCRITLRDRSNIAL